MATDLLPEINVRRVVMDRLREAAVSRSQQHNRIILWTVASWSRSRLIAGWKLFDERGFATRQRAEVAIVTSALSSIFAFVAFHHLAGSHQSVEQGHQLASAFRQFIFYAPGQAAVIVAHD